MRSADLRHIANTRQLLADCVRPDLGRLLHRLVVAILIAMLATIGGAGPALAQCSPLCLAQTAEQEQLLAPFTTLLGTTAGRNALAANFQTQDYIYLNSTQAQKIAAGTAFILGPGAAGFPVLQANILLRAFPGNPAYGYDGSGMPMAPPLPASVSAAVIAIVNNAQVTEMKPFFGTAQIYDKAYGLLPGQVDTAGNPPPYQSSSAIQNNPFTAANSSAFAAANQKTDNGNGVNWLDQPGADSQIGDFPSAHTMLATFNAITYAVLAPGHYQELAGSVGEFAYDLNVFGEHYPLDVIGGRILATYVLAETLAGNPLYPSTVPGSLGSLSQAMQGYLGGGGSSPYAAACAGNVAGCVAGGVIPSAAAYAQMAQNYARFLTYGLPSVGDTTLAPVVPADAHILLATRFPYLGSAQLNQILATTELPSGGPVDNGTGWARLNLYAAAGGYGAFPTDVTVTMNAALGGLNAFDIWSNAISGPGGLILQGSGTLVLAGNDSYTGATIVQGGTLAVTGSLAGSVAVWPGAGLAGNGAVGGSLALLAGSTFQAAVGASGATLIQVGGTATLSGGTLAPASVGNSPALGSAWPILTAAGGVSGSFNSLTEPSSGLSRGTRFDVQYGSNAIALVVTPGSYRNLAAAGLAESSSESSVGTALDAIRPAPGTAPDATHAALFGPLYTLPAGSIATGLDELAPSIYADAMITLRDSWYLMANAVGDQLAVRRGLAADSAANSAPGPQGSTIWVSALGGYDAISAGGGSPGFTTALGGSAAGIDMPVARNGRIGMAVGTVEGQTWSQTSGNVSSSTGQLVTYGQWQSGMLFTEGQLGLMYQQENGHRALPIFGASTRGATNGAAGGGGVRVGMQQMLGQWRIEPSLGFGGFGLRLDSVTETGGALAENIGRATLGSAESTLTVSAQRGFAPSETVRISVKGRLGWSHEFADNEATISAGFTGLSGSGFALNSAPIGRDAAVVGLGADIKVAGWPVAMFVGYGGAINGSSNAQSFNAGLRVAW